MFVLIYFVGGFIAFGEAISLMEYYAYTQGEDKKDWQKLKDHITAMTEMSRAFAERFGAGVYGRDTA
jgi:hypothetical protein